MNNTERHRRWAEQHKEHLKEYKRQWQLANAERIATQRRGYRQENKEQLREHARAYRQAHPEIKKATDERYRAANKESIAAAKKKWYESHKDRYKEYEASRRTQPDFKDKRHIIQRRYYRNNKEEELARLKEWKAQNPDKVHAYKVKRNTLLRDAEYELTKEQIAEIKKTGCLFCGAKKNLSIAHDLPVSKNGHTTRGNVFCLCHSCNSQMHTKSLKDILKQKLLGI